MQLEEVLDNKEFNDEAKSLILSVLYKIEESYKDYAKVKLNVKLKNEIIEETLKESIEKIYKYNGSCQFTTFVLGFAKNKCREKIRKNFLFSYRRNSFLFQFE